VSGLGFDFVPKRVDMDIRGAIILQRRGVEYELRASSASVKGEPSDFAVETAS